MLVLAAAAVLMSLPSWGRCYGVVNSNGAIVEIVLIVLVAILSSIVPKRRREVKDCCRAWTIQVGSKTLKKIEA